jgi:hypothetical protein
MPRVRQQLLLFPDEGTLQGPLPHAIRVQAEELLTDLLLAVFHAPRSPHSPTEGAPHGQNHPHTSRTRCLH